MKTILSVLNKQADQMKEAIENCGYIVDYRTVVRGGITDFMFDFLESHIAFEIGKEFGQLIN